MKLALSTLVPAAPERTFDISLDIDAHMNSMKESGERAVAGVTSGVIALGESVTWRARHFGIMWTMTTTITEWDRPSRFVDEQKKGPFRLFRHEHLFSAEGDGTRMIDDIVYDAPFGFIGDAVDRVLLHRYLRKLIKVRNDFIVGEAEKDLVGVTRPEESPVRPPEESPPADAPLQGSVAEGQVPPSPAT